MDAYGYGSVAWQPNGGGGGGGLSGNLPRSDRPPFNKPTQPSWHAVYAYQVSKVADFGTSSLVLYIVSACLVLAIVVELATLSWYAGVVVAPLAGLLCDVARAPCLQRGRHEAAPVPEGARQARPHQPLPVSPPP
jgi:hypothetical protein